MNHLYLATVFLLCTVYAEKLPSCKTPNGETASCVPLVKCMVLIQAVGTNEPAALKFFQESVCDENSSTVCCGTYGNYTEPLTTLKPPTTAKPLSQKELFEGLSKEARKDYVLKKLLPTQTYCGLQHTDDYHYNETDTSVDEFPWIVIILYWDPTNFAIRQVISNEDCVGVLINKQYVLTSKSCYDFIRSGYASTTATINMALGVHHIYKKVNCIGTKYGVDDCTDPTVFLSSTEWKIYEDVALLRLNTKLDYSDFVRPICLPLHQDDTPKPGSLVMASGWGEEQFYQASRLKLKKRMTYTVMKNEVCETNKRLKNAICGIPLESNTHYFCVGDNGGPLMYKPRGINWFAVGLMISRDDCDEVQPVISVRLTPGIVNWIIETIEP